MDVEIGAIVEGKVTGIMKFGAFVALPGGKSGLVHISEIANAYVSDIHDFLSDGQTVTVKIIGVNEAGKINLSIKQAQPAQAPAPRQPRPDNRPERQPYSRPAANTPRPQPNRGPAQGETRGPSEDSGFEDKLKHFLQMSDSRISDSKIYADRKQGGRRRK